MNVKFIQHKDIDFKKWDDAIEKSVNGLVYASSWYLDIVNQEWSALVADNYQIVMPLTFRRKYGIKYVYKPFFSQFVGVFYKDENDSKYIKDFIGEASRYFKYINMNLNVMNLCLEADYTRVRETQVLSLNKNYDALEKNYNRSNKNNIKKANKENLRIEKSTNIDTFLNLISSMYKDRNVKGVTEQDFYELKKIAEYSIKNGIGEVHYAHQNDEICASAYFLKWKNRVILYTGINEIGKRNRAIFKIIDDFIQENAGKDYVLDFSGSNIPGVKYRNLGFGAENLNYYAVLINNLPIPLKWFKR